MNDPLSKWEKKLEETAEHRGFMTPIKTILGNLFHWFMITLILTIVFAVCGSLLFLKVFTDVLKHDDTATSTTAWITFSIGGVIGVATLLYFYRKKPDLF